MLRERKNKFMEENKISELFASTLDSVKNVVDSNTVMGTPITTASGTTIIPVSKVSVGFVGGGTDFGSKKDDKKNFGGGGGTGVSASPIGFIVVSAEGDVNFISIENPTGADGVSLGEIADKAKGIIGKIKELIDKKKAEKAEKAAEAEKAHETEETAVEDAE